MKLALASCLPLIVAGCGVLLGVDDYTAVDCVERCGDAEASADAPGSESSSADAPGDASNESAAPADAAVECENDDPCDGGVRLNVVVVGPTSIELESEPLILRAHAGKPASVCVATGTELRLTFDSAQGTFEGVVCEDGQGPSDRCDFIVNGPLCVVVTIK